MAGRTGATGELCIVVPGIGGSVLVDGTSTVWDVSKRSFVEALLGGGELFRRLQLREPDHDGGVVATRLISGLAFVPGFWHYGDYRPISAFLRQRFGPDQVVEFAYDWRRSIVSSARSLRNRVERWLAERPLGTRVVLVGHSMGGLVARRYLACEGGAEHCSLLVTVGTPFLGAMRALDYLAHGHWLLLGRAGTAFGEFLCSLPSVHELLPSYDCFLHADGTCSGIGDWLPAAVASTGLAPGATAVHAETAEAVAALDGAMPSTLCIAGQHQWTPTLARRGADGDFSVITQGRLTRRYDPRSRGDGTVPRGSAQPPEWRRDPSRAHVVGGRHVDLPSAAGVHLALTAALEGRESLTLGADSEHGLELALSQIVPAGQPVEVEVSHPDDRLSLEVTVTDIHDRTDVAHAALANLGGGLYRQVVSRLPPGQYVVRVTGLADGGPRRVSDLVIVLPADAR